MFQIQPKKIIITIGTQIDQNGRYLCPDRVYEALSTFDKLLIDKFGGFTKTDGHGAYTDDNNKVVQESCVIYNILVNKLTSRLESKLLKDINWIKKELNQESILLEILDSKHRFIC